MSSRKEAVITIWYILKSFTKFLAVFPFVFSVGLAKNFFDFMKDASGIFLMLFGSLASLLRDAVFGERPLKTNREA